MIGIIIGLGVLVVAVSVLIVVFATKSEKKQNTYKKHGVPKKKIFEFTFSGHKDLNEAYNSQTIMIYEDCIIVSKDNGSFVSYERIKLFDLDQCVFEIFDGMYKGDAPVLCISFISYALVEQSLRGVNDTDWKATSTSKIFIMFRFDTTEKVLYERELKGIHEIISNTLEKAKSSEDYIEDKKTFEEIQNSVFMKSFINIYGCNLDVFKRKLVLVSGHNKLLNEYPVSQMAMVYDKTNQRIALCQFKENAQDLKTAMQDLSVEEKLLFISKSELQTNDDYLELIKEASIDKFRKLFTPIDSISQIEYVNAVLYTSKKPNMGFSLVTQSPFIHPKDIAKNKEKSSSDVSRYLITFNKAAFEKMYIDKMYFNETFSKHYSFLKQFLKEKASS